MLERFRRVGDGIDSGSDVATVLAAGTAGDSVQAPGSGVAVWSSSSVLIDAAVNVDAEAEVSLCMGEWVGSGAGR